MRFKGKVAIITGSAQGIGRATAELFVQEGAIVVLNDLQDKVMDLADDLREKGETRGFVCDVTDMEKVQQMVDETVSSYGKVDILVNTVALPHRKTIMDTPLEEFDQIINVNLKAVFCPVKAVLPYMIKQNYGRIVNVSSITGLKGGGMLGRSTYAASKAGVIGLTKGIAREVGSYGITVNTVAPGLSDTPRNAHESEERIKRCVQGITLGRMGTSEDSARAVAFLSSDEAEYVHGIVFPVDGGNTYR